MKRSTGSIFVLVCILAVGILSGCNEDGKKKASKHQPKHSQNDSPAAAAQGSPGPIGPKLNLELGAGYNEQIANINNSVVAKSGARWVRAYVNLSRNFWVFGAPILQPPPSQPLYPITGVVEGNIIQEPSNVSSDADALAVAALDQLINTKTVIAGGAPVKIILSLKHDFSYPYPKGATVPAGQFPDVSTPAGLAEADQMVTAIENLLITNNRGNEIDILVTGNEPMFEIQPNSDPDTARKYKLYLNSLIQQLVDLKAAENTKTVAGVQNTWDFQIFVGALNSPINPPPSANVILPAVLEVARDNVSVAGIDLHEHVAATTEVRSDIQYVKDQTKFRPLGALPLQIISTEFSIIRLFEANMNNPVPLGSTLPPLWQFLNNTTAQAATGTPVQQSQFLSYFLAQSWYPRNWFREMINAFEAEGVLAVTYGIEEAPRYPWSDNQLVPTATPWVLNGVFNATLLGRSADGYPNTNPLVYPEFRNAISRMK
ncbi:MAG: hypothetical protein NTV93_06290 [Verrucomicrobia bacterium]|nr:hypothetical protein [Verrucomicrobiota bacterium]